MVSRTKHEPQRRKTKNCWDHRSSRNRIWADGCLDFISPTTQKVGWTRLQWLQQVLVRAQWLRAVLTASEEEAHPEDEDEDNLVTLTSPDNVNMAMSMSMYSSTRTQSWTDIKSSQLKFSNKTSSDQHHRYSSNVMQEPSRNVFKFQSQKLYLIMLISIPQ